MSFNIEVHGGKTVRLPTKGKYCDRDIVITGRGEDYGIIKAGTYIPNETYEMSIALSIRVPFTCNEVEYDRISVSSANDIISYKGPDGMIWVGENGQFTDRSPITILEDSDTADLVSYPAEYEWFMKHYTMQGGGGSGEDDPQLAPTPSLVYTLSSDGSYYIVGTGFTSTEAIETDIGGGVEGSGLDSTWTGGKLVIPAKYNGKPVLAIAPRAFAGFYNITQVYIYDGITHIGHRGLQCPNKPWDNAMTSCRLPNTLVHIGGEDGRVFYGRQGLISMAIPPNIGELPRAVFAYCNSLAAAYTYNVKKLVRSCFQDCSSLTTLNTDNLEEIGDVSFYNCTDLTELNLPKIETIGNNVFYNTSSLAKVTIGPNCRSIDTSGLHCGSTVDKCTFYFEGTTPPTIQSKTFDVDKLNKIVVPKGCGNSYKTATNWSSFASYIEEAAE